MQQLGDTNQDLITYYFQTFLNLTQIYQIRNSDLQRKRYQHIENIRKERIEEIKSLRETILKLYSKKTTMKKAKNQIHCKIT